ncbi:hypothetical protein J5Y03_15110 [Bacillus sp. RG28]|uniref:DUF6933 domain-containing protein n=1 Tax=Gottfriedia endophytica TaxID=2820819 RepID=A0A940NS18_9BACI|nr:hypothetical protein [Gottfriedia endophytica]MBP0726488.1 hypothetical protein [Gottfriedia endophytica]
MIIQCTKKLADEMKLKVSKPDLLNVNQIYCWHAHLFKIGRKKCVLVMNNVTRYHFVLYGLVKKDFVMFEEIVKMNIVSNFLADGINPDHVDWYINQLGDIQFYATSDRSIISQMNDSILSLEYIIYYEAERGNTIDIFEINRDLNCTPMMKIPKYPNKMMIDALNEQYSKN